MKKYWVCIIERINDGELPHGFDSVPRRAAIDAIEKKGVLIKECWSGWGCDKDRVDDIMDAWNKEKSQPIKLKGNE